MKLIVNLPWPDRKLVPNARVFWAAKAKEVKRHRRLAFMAALDLQEQIPAAVRANEEASIYYTISYEPKINRKRDEDGVIAACKSYLDGVSEAIGINDCRFHIRGCEALPAKKPGSITLAFWWDQQ